MGERSRERKRGEERERKRAFSGNYVYVHGERGREGRGGRGKRERESFIGNKVHDMREPREVMPGRQFYCAGLFCRVSRSLLSG